VDAASPRSRAQRRTDTLAKLAAPVTDVWVATASADGGGTTPYLVPLSLAWLHDRVVLALESTSRTARNLEAQQVARLGVGPTRDVVLIDVVLESIVKVSQAPTALADGYAAQSDWDPRDAGEGYAYVILRPERIQAWREVDELPGRTLMRDGRWLLT
jgi:hypothetical protein